MYEFIGVSLEIQKEFISFLLFNKFLLLYSFVHEDKEDESHVKGNFTFSMRCSKPSIISEERDFRGQVAGLVKTLAQESMTVKRENGMFRNYWEIENKAEKHNGTSHTWILSIVGNPMSLPLGRHNWKSAERASMMKKITEQLPEKGLDRQGVFSPEKRHCGELLTELQNHE